MSSNPIPPENRESCALHLYKAHYTAKEAAILMDIHYQYVSTYYKKFKLMGIEKADRSKLVPTKFREQLPPLTLAEAS